jgi:hypothetical protein
MKNLILFTVFAFSLQVNAQNPMQEFNFNGTLSNTNNTAMFSGVSKFVNDRTGVPNSAQRLTNTALEVTMGNLPLSNTSRTVSIWVKYNDITTANYIWGYGASSNAQYFGLLQQRTTTTKSDLNLAGWGPANDLIVTTTIAPGTWYNYTVTYDGLTSKIYRNGELIKSSISPRKLTSGIVFGIGRMGTAVSINADIDDLKIYDVALTSEEVASLYNATPVLASNDLLASAKSVKTAKGVSGKAVKAVSGVSATNPSLVLTTPKETTVLKTAEVFSTKGLKVITSTKEEINIGELPEGTYLLKVENVNKAVNAKKLTVN